MVPGEIFLAHFPFGGTLGRKVRPALLLTGPQGSVPEYVVAYITSVAPTDVLITDLQLDPSQPEFASTKLKKTSWLRLHKLATVHHLDLVRRIGALEPQLLLQVADKLRLLFTL